MPTVGTRLAQPPELPIEGREVDHAARRPGDRPTPEGW